MKKIQKSETLKNWISEKEKNRRKLFEKEGNTLLKPAPIKFSRKSVRHRKEGDNER